MLSSVGSVICLQTKLIEFPLAINPHSYINSFQLDFVNNFPTPWCHQTETFSALLVICAGNSPVPGDFPAQRPLTWSFYVFFYLRLNKPLSKQLWGGWFETLSRRLWRHCNDNETTSQRTGPLWSVNYTQYVNSFVEWYCKAMAPCLWKAATV